DTPALYHSLRVALCIKEPSARASSGPRALASGRRAKASGRRAMVSGRGDGIEVVRNLLGGTVRRPRRRVLGGGPHDGSTVSERAATGALSGGARRGGAASSLRAEREAAAHAAGLGIAIDKSLP